MAMSHSTGTPTWFERVREEQVRRGEARYPRVIRALGAVDALYLCSVPAGDAFLRRDGSVWEVSEPAFPRIQPMIWREVTGRHRLAVLSYASSVVPELRELLPVRPADAVNCPGCYGRDVIVGFASYPVCAQCCGLGWVSVEAI